MAWRWRFPEDQVTTDRSGTMSFIYEATPLMIDGVLYTITSFAQVSAVDPVTGETQWSYDSGTVKARARARGLAYWTDGTRKRLISARQTPALSLWMRSPERQLTVLARAE